MEQVNANVYTYKVPVSQSTVEDAANLVQLVQRDIADVMAIDEDEAFLIGDGVGKPHGILPGSANGNSLTEVVTGNASLLTSDGLIDLTEGIADQYMERASFAMRRSTVKAIRKLKTGDGEYLFDRYMEGGRAIAMLLGYSYGRTEAMPSIASSAYPIIFGDFGGYTIVERAGLTIARYQDSYTGINKVEFHVRRRVGGHIEQPWRFAVQKVAAS
jgi:HK97 family phage major capsid protein